MASKSKCNKNEARFLATLGTELHSLTWTSCGIDVVAAGAARLVHSCEGLRPEYRACRLRGRSLRA